MTKNHVFESDLAAITFPRQRRAIARLVFDLMVDRDVATGIQDLEDRLIYHAIMHATLDGMLSTPNKISLVTGLNRTTVTRRIKKLAEQGVLTSGDGNSFAINPTYANSESIMNRMKRIRQAIRESAATMI